MKSSGTGGAATAHEDFRAIKVWLLTAAAGQIPIVLRTILLRVMGCYDTRSDGE
jgi:hypothetical protein